MTIETGEDQQIWYDDLETSDVNKDWTCKDKDKDKDYHHCLRQAEFGSKRSNVKVT